jgi:predicted alpha/beta hydrolase
MTLRQVATAIGIVLMVLSAAALLLTIRDFTQAIRLGGASGAYHSAQVVFYGVFAVITLLFAAILLRPYLRRRTPRLMFALATIVVVVAGTYTGYAG